MQQGSTLPVSNTFGAAPPDKPWDSELAAMLDSSMISGYALVSHRGEPIAARGALQPEFAARAASGAVLPGPVMLQLFDAGQSPAHHCTAFTLCGTRYQVCRRLKCQSDPMLCG